MNDGSQQSFQREYRNWSNLSSLSFVPLNSPNIPALTPVLASVTQYQIAGIPTPNTYGILNTFVNNQFNVGSAAQQITQQQIPTSSPPPNYYQMDDNEINSFIGVTMGYSDCRKPDMVSYCLRATETDNFTIPFLDNNYNSNVRNGAFIPVTNGFVDPTIGNVSFPLESTLCSVAPFNHK